MASNPESQHRKALAAAQKRIQDILDAYERDITRLAGFADFKSGEPFRFENYPALRARYDRMISELRNAVKEEVEASARREWARADEKNDDFAASVIGSRKAAAALGYLSRNNSALEAFLERKSNGMTLSDRVWRYTGQYSTQIQDAIDISLRDGLSADELSRRVRGYLVQPDRLFRRVRDEHGMLHLSRNAAAYHPGQGVYRSSYMNARRMAVTEINMAYRTSDYMRIQQLDFVVGIQVHLSNNHNCKGVPPGQFYDICDELQGKYPKGFKFTGWHPNCRCYVTTIIKTKEELMKDSDGSVNEVKDVPGGFKDWLQENSDRISSAKQLPYFLRDNGQVKNGSYVLNESIAKAGCNSPPKTTANNLTEVINDANTAGVKRVAVSVADKTLSTDDIIKKVCGADRTSGSCSSLAFAYAGNKAGYNVEDFRGGNSCDFFASNLNIRKITEKVGGIIEMQVNDFTGAKNLFATMSEGKEYYFACGRHAAIIRKAENGLEYLELQSGVQNGWKELTRDALKRRFSARTTHSTYGYKYAASSVLIDIELLKNDKGFKELLEYINTLSANQKKGAGGGIK